MACAVAATWVVTATQAEGRWRLVFAEGFEKPPAGRPVGEPWVQRHARRQVVVTNEVAASGKQSAMYRYEVSAEGSLDQEAGCFFIETPIPRPKDDPSGVWRITCALRFSPIAWTASTFRLRGDHWKSCLALVNSNNLLFLGGNLDKPVWNVAVPDRWYRVEITLREEQGVYDLKVGEEGSDYRNVFYDLPMPPESVPFKYVGFGYCGALVRYGQGRTSFVDDVRVERLEK